MSFKLPWIYVHGVDVIGSAVCLVLALWVFYEALGVRRRGFMYQYLFLLSCSLAAFALSRAVGHILRNFLLYAGYRGAWSELAPICGASNTLIFAITASLSFYYGVFRNMHDARIREQEKHVKDIQETRDFLQEIIDSLNTQLLVIDREYRIVMVNRRFMEDSNLPREEVLGKLCHEVLNRFREDGSDCRKEDSDPHGCPWRSIREHGVPVSMIHVHRYPQADEPWHMEVSASPVFGKDGIAEYIIETLTNVTDKLRMEEMQRTQEKLNAVVEMASAVAHELNTPMFTVLGNAQLLQRNVRLDERGVKDVEAIIRNVKKMSRLTRQMTHITEYMTKDYVAGDRLVDIMAASGPALDEDGQGQRDRAEREEKWVRLERMAAMGELSAGVAHELNNALNIVLGYSQLLLREAQPDTTTRSDLEKIEKNAKQCQRIVSGLLEYTRSVASEKAFLDVNAHLEDVLKLVENRMSLDGIRIVRQFSPDLKPVRMDAYAMKQVYLNLLNNAAQAIGEKGSVFVRTEMDPDRNMVVISILDTGPGIPPKVMDRLFTPFFTTKGAGLGTGLGLNVSRDIVHQHGGVLEAENRPEGGAALTVRLPIVPASVDAPEQ